MASCGTVFRALSQTIYQVRCKRFWKYLYLPDQMMTLDRTDGAVLSSDFD